MIGLKQAKELLLTGDDRVTTERALALGLINKVVPEGSHLDEALAVARTIAANDRSAVVATKEAINRGADVLIVDTAGRMHTERHLMEELTKIRDVIAKKIEGAPHEVILVLDATVGQNAVNQARQFAQAIDVTGIFMAKLDGTAKGGIVVAIREELNIPVKFIGVGETPDDVEPFEPTAFVEAMFAV